MNLKMKLNSRVLAVWGLHCGVCILHGLLGVLNHLSAVGCGAGGDLQAGHLAHSGACETVHTVGTHLHPHHLLSNTMSPHQITAAF